MERERRLQSSLLQEEGVHRRRHGRQVQEELKERQTESALLKVHHICLVTTFACRLWQLLCLPILNQSTGNPNPCLLVGRRGEVKQSKTTSTRGENG